MPQVKPLVYGECYCNLSSRSVQELNTAVKYSHQNTAGFHQFKMNKPK